jgi:hypothetical protein
MKKFKTNSTMLSFPSYLVNNANKALHKFYKSGQLSSNVCRHREENYVAIKSTTSKRFTNPHVHKSMLTMKPNVIVRNLQE